LFFKLNLRQPMHEWAWIQFPNYLSPVNDIIEQMQSFPASNREKLMNFECLRFTKEVCLLLDAKEHRELWKYSGNVSGIIEHYTCYELEWKERLGDYSKLNSFVRVMRFAASLLLCPKGGESSIIVIEHP
jgi:hypothetical protein